MKISKLAEGIANDFEKSVALGRTQRCADFSRCDEGVVMTLSWINDEVEIGSSLGPKRFYKDPLSGIIDVLKGLERGRRSVSSYHSAHLGLEEADRQNPKRACGDESDGNGKASDLEQNAFRRDHDARKVTANGPN